MASPSCVLKSQSSARYLQSGDVTLGVILELFMTVVKQLEKFVDPPEPVKCYRPSLRYYRHLLAAVYAIEEINQNPNILPNVTLGFHIYDSCSSERQALANTLSILSGKRAFIPNYACDQNGVMVAIIGHLLSSLSYAASEITGLLNYPQISYGAQDPIFIDRRQFPMLYRTIINEKIQNEAIIQLLNVFNWKWVGIVGSLDETHRKATEELRDSIIKNGGCVAFLVHMSVTDAFSYTYALDVISKSSANVIIINTNLESFINFIFAEYQPGQKPKYIWVASSTLDIDTMKYGLFFNLFNGSLLFSLHSGEIPGLKEFMYSASPSTFPNDELTANLWRVVFSCVSEKDRNANNSYFPLCTNNDTMKIFENALFNVNDFRLTFSMYTAVYALAHALDNMILDKENEDFQNAPGPISTLSTWKLNQYLKKVIFKNVEDEISFNEFGETPGRLDIMNWNVFPNGTVTNRKVGTYHSSGLSEKQLIIQKDAILWGPQFNELTVYGSSPTSLCNAQCSPGYRKAIKKGQPVCCYDCIQCSEGEISNETDAVNCIQCPEDQWSNEKNDKCIMRSIDFLSFDERLGLALSLLAVIFTIITIVIFGIFLKHRETPIVKANNRGLSYSILCSLMMSFLCSLLFIGHPVKITCLLRHVAFGINFSISISSVLGKTITVVIAFNAVKPESKLKHWVGSTVPKYLVILCLLGEVMICSVWLLAYPPYPDYDSKSQPSKIILQCNEGSVIAFYLSVGYVAILAFVSFIAAFLARKLPAVFNEARHITFSMLVFCSVWISFIPTYLSTKGKYMVAVEIFAILASNCGILVCIFLPKCYIIVIRPELNTRKHLNALKS
ncbi:vomeronasal type-2 receptor 26-like [Discoglossus pictus]